VLTGQRDSVHVKGLSRASHFYLALLFPCINAMAWLLLVLGNVTRAKQACIVQLSDKLNGVI
jgi:hypothetical protein